MSTEARRIGKYELRERLGQGVVTEVWKAFDTQLQRYVAIKLLHDDLQNDPDFVKRFVREARLVASLHHPNIVQVHDFQVFRPSESGTTIAYMVMDYIEGQTLADYMHSTSNRGNFPPAADIVHLFISISNAIDYAHQHGMIHRDIKPANILLDKRNTAQNPAGEPILTDFGIAKFLTVSTGALSGSWLGTPLYIAPEQVQGYPGNEYSDIYSLGVILYEMCTGVLPFRGDTSSTIMMQHVNALPASPDLINPHISPALAAVILRSLAKDPTARFHSASSMAAAIAEAFNIPVPENLGHVTPSNDVITSPTSSVQSQLALPLEPSETPLPLYVVATPSTPSVILSAAKDLTAASASPLLTPPTRVQVSSLTPVLSPPLPSRSGKERRGLYGLLIALLIIILVGSGLSTFYVLSHKQPAAAGMSSTPPIVGHAFYISSGLLSEDSNQGIDDEFQIDLQNIVPPITGKSYYAWLLGDRLKNTKENHCKAQAEQVFLGRLPVSHGIVHFSYLGDQNHTNLIGCTSVFLITEEGAKSPPAHPSTDRRTWHYYAELPQMPDPKDAVLHLSALDNIRHLLFEGSNLQVLGIHGGLDIRFLRNAQKVWEWASSARDAWGGSATGSILIHRLIVRIMDYLDGTAPNLVQTEVPRGTPVLVNPQLGQVAMLDIPKRTGSYVGRISHQLNIIVQDPGVTANMRTLAAQLSKDISNVRNWLKEVHDYAKQLVTMNDTQLRQPAVLAMLDDMQSQANYAFVGRIDPSTNEAQAGVSQIHDGIQQLATFDVAPYSA